jgi:hypothetical protein
MSVSPVSGCWALQGIEASMLIVESGFLIAPGCGLTLPRDA